MTESSVPPHLAPGANPAPGWRADPWFTGQYRWWDGAAWSGDVFPEVVSSYGAGPMVNERPPAERPPAPPPWQRADPPPPPPAWVISQLSGPATAPPVFEAEPPQPARSRLSAKALLALLLVFGIAVGAVIGLLLPHSSSKRTPAAATPPPVTSSPPASPQPPSTPAPSTLPANGLLQRFSLRQSDLPAGQSLTLIRGGDSLDDPTFDLCDGTYASESRRVARLQLAAETKDGKRPISSEAVLYDSPAATVQAFAEMRKVAGNCSSTSGTRFGAAPDAHWPTVAGVQRLAYSITSTDADGTSSSSTVIYLRRGKALLGLYVFQPGAGDPRASVSGKTSAADIAAIFEQRLASLPASAIGA